jgi:hypothetical protein
MELADEDDDNVCIHSAYQADDRAMFHGIQQVNQYFLSAPSWLYSGMWLVSVPTTVIPDVVKSCLPSGQSEMNVKSSCWFVGSRRKSCQFPGSLF